MPYGTGDTVVYAGSNVCKIAEIRPMKVGGSEKLYYVLKPVFEPQSTVYHPFDGGEDKLTLPIDAATANEILSAPVEIKWIEDDRLRHEEFTQILKNGSCAEVVSVVKLIFARKKKSKAENKKLRAADERTLNDGRRIVSEQIAFALGVTKDEAVLLIDGEA